MAAPADVIFVEGQIHTFGDPDRTAEAMAVRNGTVCRVADTYEVEFLEGINTRRIDLDGRTVIPGFVDGHSHLLRIGFRIHRADLQEAKSLNDALHRLRRDALSDRDWVLGFGFDETTWPGGTLPTPKELDSVSERRPVAAFRKDMETVVLNSAGLAVVTRSNSGATADTDDTPPGVLTGPNAAAVWRAIGPDRVEETRFYLEAAFAHAQERGVTTVFDDVRYPETARAYHQLAVEAELPIRVGVNYRNPPAESDRLSPLQAAHSLGLVSGVGTDPLQMESLGTTAGTADEEVIADFIQAATEAGFRVTVDIQERDALDSVIEAVEESAAQRPRISYSGPVTDEQAQALAEAGAVVIDKIHPNLDAEPGDNPSAKEQGDRDHLSRFGRFTSAGVPYSFGSNGFEMTPLRDIDGVGTGGSEHNLGVTEALRIATGSGDKPTVSGSWTDTLEVGAPADFAILSDSPWETPPADVSVQATVIDGTIVYES